MSCNFLLFLVDCRHANLAIDIAYSASYIANRTRPITIGKLSFFIHRLEVDEVIRLTGNGDETGVMIFSVSKGRVVVTLGGTRFSIGEGGMWRVRGGEAFVFSNRAKEETIVHVTQSV